MPTSVPLLQIACQQQKLPEHYMHHSFHTYPMLLERTASLEHSSLNPRLCGRRKVACEQDYSHALQYTQKIKANRSHCFSPMPQSYENCKLHPRSHFLQFSEEEQSFLVCHLWWTQAPDSYICHVHHTEANCHSSENNYNGRKMWDTDVCLLRMSCNQSSRHAVKRPRNSRHKWSSRAPMSKKAPWLNADCYCQRDGSSVFQIVWTFMGHGLHLHVMLQVPLVHATTEHLK